MTKKPSFNFAVSFLVLILTSYYGITTSYDFPDETEPGNCTLIPFCSVCPLDGRGVPVCQGCVGPGLRQVDYTVDPAQCACCKDKMPRCLLCKNLQECALCEFPGESPQGGPDGTYVTATGAGCAPCAPNCTACTYAGQCDSCKQGFYLSNKLCAACPFQCKVCSSATTCNFCLPGYGLNNGICTPCPMNNCQACTFSPLQCTQCWNGTVSTSGTCTCSPNCLSCSRFGTCDICQSGYQRNSNTLQCFQNQNNQNQNNQD